jgi:hypothetical protein
MRAVETSRSDIVSRLESNGFEVETDPEVKLTYGGDEIIENDLKDVLEIFRLDDGQIGLYERDDDIENLTEFLIKGTAAPDTAENVVATFKELLEDTEEVTTHLAPTIQFLTRWNKAWRKQKGVSRWLPEEQWEELNEQIEEIHGPADQEVVEGFAYTRFGHDVDTLSEYSLNVPNVTVDIASDRLVDTVESEHAVILHQPTTVDDMSDLKSDLTTLRDADKRPIAYVLFATEQERREKRGTLRGGPADDSGWREQPGAGIRKRGRNPAVHRARIPRPRRRRRRRYRWHRGPSCSYDPFGPAIIEPSAQSSAAGVEDLAGQRRGEKLTGSPLEARPCTTSG